MSKPIIGPTLRRLRTAQGLSQQSLAQKLGISTSYLNLIEHDQRGVTANLLFKLAKILDVDLETLSGDQERDYAIKLREVFADPMLGIEDVPESETQAIAAVAPNAIRAILALHRAWAGAREDSDGITLPSGRRILLPNEEVREYFHTHSNHFPSLEQAAEAISSTLQSAILGTNHALAERLRQKHGLLVVVRPLPDNRRTYDPVARLLTLSETLSRESRGFQMAFQLALLECRDVFEALVRMASPTSPDAAELLRVGLLNYIAGAIIMPYQAFLDCAEEFRYDVDRIAARFGVSYEQACQRLSSLQRSGARGVPFFFLRVDPAGNLSKRFSAAGFPFMRFGGTCPRWVVHSAFATPGTTRVQIAQLPDGQTFLCFARAIAGRPARWGDPPPIHVVAMGCDIAQRDSLAYSDGIDVEKAAVGIGLSCRLCDRQDCRSRAFPPLAHRLTLDPKTSSASPYSFEAKRK
jgi:predicted transcriptional regulator/transcriptional regulator with XRE-family HTH domain